MFCAFYFDVGNLNLGVSSWLDTQVSFGKWAFLFWLANRKLEDLKNFKQKTVLINSNSFR